MDIKGSCLCGAVAFAIRGRPSRMGTCHCSRCRKLGTSTMVFVERSNFALLQGRDAIETVTPEAPFTYHRSFCRMCGTSLGEPLSPDAFFPLNAQCLDDDLGLENRFHEHVEDRPPWAADPRLIPG